jgi:radical SAM protein with 4Fe4S-binding SPASM domain
MGFGGLWEPLLSKDLPELIAHGRQSGLVEAMFSTNGYFLDEAAADDLIKAGLTRIMISLDAVSDKTYNLSRPNSDLKRVESNIMGFLERRRLAKSRLPLVRVSFCLTSLNESELPLFIERWRDKVDFFSIQSYGRFTPEAPALFPKLRTVPLPAGICAQPFKRLQIRHNGQVLPCCDLSGLSLTLGDIGDGLKTIWEGERLKGIREGIKNNDLPAACKECQEKYRLAGEA